VVLAGVAGILSGLSSEVSKLYGMRLIGKSVLCVIVLGVLLVSAGCVGSPQVPATVVPTPAEPVPGNTTAPATMTTPRGELVAFVDRAVAYAHTNGKERALFEFSDPNGSFVQGELYIYAYDFSGLTIAHPFNPEKIGQSRIAEKDALGSLFIKNLRDAALNGSGFVSFAYINPAHNRTVEEKLGYVKKVDDSWWLGSGIYAGPLNRTITPTLTPGLTPNSSGLTATLSPGLMAPAGREDLVRFVERAQVFARQHSRNESLAVFNNRTGEFVSGSLYIFAYDYDGTTRALPFQPELLGTNRMETVDAQGMRFIENLSLKAKSGGGFVEYLYVDPSQNFSVQKKTGYAVDVDGQWFLGSGIYA